MKRQLSEEQAAACETASDDRCRCRCRGRFHGSARGDLAKLPRSDPHSPAGRAQCDRGKHLYPPGDRAAFRQKCLRCGQVVARRRRLVKGEFRLQAKRIH